ncbi:protein of unknown function [Pseudomonas sp. JV241A]|jgi:hypothetical protein|nr:protein of unknown function [Pseudomonas sp. JV241A]
MSRTEINQEVNLGVCKTLYFKAHTNVSHWIQASNQQPTPLIAWPEIWPGYADA